MPINKSLDLPMNEQVWQKSLVLIF